ncbi:peptidase M24, structural domain-containing protein [Gamsiella multidivaricata]|uniref:peptidase M24, structural domain-containing protein n=1 Tax=Gamsiella multidivaricata TaxID=101098 RepID=UPI002220F4C4|nr:peptidase M24, structural domain-containing protein [Gamsiella multidivaricata]KAI7823603.1 peptidase M24, structural domain-containing protein [Gamsiella multidivaricata]
MATANNGLVPNATDLERQPLLNSQSSNQARSHIPSALGRPSEQHQRQKSVRKCWRIGVLAILLALLGFFVMGVYDLIAGRVGNPRYSHLNGSCDHVRPISPAEFEERQANLSSLLVDLKATAYIAEPGSNMKYFTNIRWSQSERPFLLVIQAKRDNTDRVLTKATIVAPAFEASRARQGLLPGSSISIKTWEEGGSAYKVVREVLETPWVGPDDDDEKNDADVQGDKKEKPKEMEQIYIDPDMRQFVSHGLYTALESSTRKLSIANRDISLLRMQKTAHEIEILRCVSTTTVNVIRAIKGDITVGIRESEVQELLTEAYQQAGLEYEHGNSLVLFGKDAALPHGSGNDTSLEKGMMVLIDSGARLHGYLSDITRTFWIKRGDSKDMNDELDKVWDIVKNAQQAALHTVRPGASCASVDKAARSLIASEGYGIRFTHRLGHGLGLDGHEDPYLNIGNTDTALRPGMVFTNEPGIYVEGSFGIRLEDVVLVTENGYEILSGDLAESAYDP